MKVSRGSVRRFIRFFLAIEKPELCLHQTLTFWPPEKDEKRARTLFRNLMDNLHHRFRTMASVYVRERQANGGIHYHVLFYCFERETLPFPFSRMEEQMRALIFPIWNKMQNGRLIRKANRLTAVTPQASYFLKKLELSPRGERRWWGCWNRELLQRHAVAPSRKAIDSQMEWYFGSERARLRRERLLRHPAEPKRGVFSRANVRFMKETTREIAFESWAEYKARVAGLGRSVTDEEFRAVLNERRKADATYMPPSAN